MFKPIVFSFSLGSAPLFSTTLRVVTISTTWHKWHMQFSWWAAQFNDWQPMACARYQWLRGQEASWVIKEAKSKYDSQLSSETGRQLQFQCEIEDISWGAKPTKPLQNKSWWESYKARGSPKEAFLLCIIWFESQIFQIATWHAGGRPHEIWWGDEYWTERSHRSWFKAVEMLCPFISTCLLSINNSLKHCFKQNIKVQHFGVWDRSGKISHYVSLTGVIPVSMKANMAWLVQVLMTYVLL